MNSVKNQYEDYLSFERFLCKFDLNPPKNKNIYQFAADMDIELLYITDTKTTNETGGSMIKRCLHIIMLFSTMLFAESETIALSGSVKDTDGNAIEGVNVSLAIKNELTAVTNANGEFSITSGTSLLKTIHSDGALVFTFKRNTVVFTPTTRQLTGSMAVYSGNGKRLAYVRLNNIKVEKHVTLPELGSGIYLLQLEVNGEVFTRSMVCMGSELFLKNGNSSGMAPFTLAKMKSGAPIDTIIAGKEGYETAKVSVASYSEDNIAITLEPEGASGGECTRESMMAIVDKYIEAQKAGDPSLMPLAADAKILENTEEVSLEESFLTNALKIDLHRSIYDVDSCRSFTEIIVATTEPTTVMGTRLRIVDDKITEVDAIITNDGEWLYDAEKYLEYSQQEEDEWYILPEEERPTREFLIDAGNQYFDMFKGDFDDLPWGGPCYRIEGGAVTYQGNPQADYCKIDASGLSSTNVNITGRDFIVDVEMGTVNVYCKLCTLDSHVFRLVDGHYRFVHTLTVGCNM